MYWDIVEVLTKAGYSLFVRFKDGSEGVVRLQPEQLTGALEPLRTNAQPSNSTRRRLAGAIVNKEALIHRRTREELCVW